MGKVFRRRNPGGGIDVRRAILAAGGVRMDAVVYVMRLIVLVMAILSVFGLR